MRIHNFLKCYHLIVKISILLLFVFISTTEISLSLQYKKLFQFPYPGLNNDLICDGLFYKDNNLYFIGEFGTTKTDSMYMYRGELCKINQSDTIEWSTILDACPRPTRPRFIFFSKSDEISIFSETSSYALKWEWWFQKTNIRKFDLKGEQIYNFTDSSNQYTDLDMLYPILSHDGLPILIFTPQKRHQETIRRMVANIYDSLGYLKKIKYIDSSYIAVISYKLGPNRTYYASCRSDSSNSSYVIKIDSNFTLLWKKEMTGYGKNISAIFVLNDGSVLVSGNGYFNKLDSLGNVIWWTSLSENNKTASLTQLYQNSEGDFIIIGMQYNGNNKGRFIAKIGKNGDIIWQDVVDERITEANNCFSQIVEYAINKYYLTSSEEYGTVLYKFEDDFNSIVLDNFNVIDLKINISPNPAIENATIKFDLEQSGNVSLNISTFFGNKISLINNQFMDIGSHSYDWDASGYPAAVYFYVLQVGNNVKTGKVVVVK
jgi:hypothetical protein